MTSVPNINTPQVENVRSGVADDIREHLSVILAETYMLTIRLNLYHWNVVGPLFKSIHDLTEDHYENLFAATDKVAKRIRALGHRASVKMQEGKLNLMIALHTGGMPYAQDMIKELVKRHGMIAADLCDVATFAGGNVDVVTE